MSHKYRLKEIHDKIKDAASKHPENTELHNAINELHGEITAMDDPPTEGGNNPPPPDEA